MNPAHVYEQRFVPSLFGPWGVRLSEHLGVEPGHHCLDVACGTGALTRSIAARTRGRGRVVGLDVEPAMLEVARTVVPGAEWVEGDAMALPFEGGVFDRVGSQFGLMFVPDPARALKEMVRVCRPGGRVVVATCAAVERSPGYAVLTEVLHRLFGPDVADAFRAPFTLGTEGQWREIAKTAEVTATVGQMDGEVRFDSIRDLVESERSCAWTLGGRLDERAFSALLEAAESALAPFVDGSALRFAMPAMVVTATA